MFLHYVLTQIYLQCIYIVHGVGSHVFLFSVQNTSSINITGDSMSHINGMKFTTKDQDNDQSSRNCAVSYNGAWWYKSCHSANLNGLYLSGTHTTYADGVEWTHWMGYYYSLKFTEMKTR